MSWAQRDSALFWVYCAALVLGPVLFLAQAFGLVVYGGGPALAALPITALTFLVFGGILFWLDMFRARTRLLAPIVMGFAWGFLVWPGTALWANDRVTRVVTNLGGDEFASNWQAAIAAPIDEEFIKAIGIAVVAVLFRSRLSRPMHGFLIGGAVGLGAQISEDMLYSLQTAVAAPQNPARDVFVVALLRLVTAFTSHWAMSALVGVGIVVLLTRTDRSWAYRVATFVLFYLLAVSMHAIFDAPRAAGPGVLALLLPVVIDLAIFLLAYRWVLAAERKWFRATISQPVAREFGPEPALESLLTHRGRHRARAALRSSFHYTYGQAKQYERDLLTRIAALADEPAPAVRYSPPGALWTDQQTVPR
ncbi:PrsW family intramembrane metalloprotease [Nocardia sp. NPDC057668]|uniref:PrsW family intramembrane metalloprotease n=1 Tax=Nocardia sp. NPDC057668 TaxID=3346202 RepID=UPI00366BABD7